MAVTKKPDFKKDPQGFIGSAKAENKSSTKQNVNLKPSSQTQKRVTKKRSSTETSKIKTTKKAAGAKETTTKKMTVYLTKKMYLNWKKYELRQTVKNDGQRVSFQQVVTGYLEELFKQH